MHVVQNELAYRYNGRISDEGVSGTWTGNPKKYYGSYEQWIKDYWFDYCTNVCSGNDLNITESINMQIRSIPKSLVLLGANK
jgi:hypothetical protein